MTCSIFTNLILIGGGVMRNGETVHIDKWMLKKIKRGSKKPKVLFISAASSDLEEYITDFKLRYTRYGAIVDILFLIRKNPSLLTISRKINNSDLIYFGGGDPTLLLKTFKKYSLENICKRALKRGITICGLSAGAAIWGKEFLNAKWNGSQFVNYRLERGLGWLKEIVWTHFTDEAVRKKRIISLFNQESRILAIGDRVAIYWDKSSQIKALKSVSADFGFLGEFAENGLSFQQIGV